MNTRIKCRWCGKEKPHHNKWIVFHKGNETRESTQAICTPCFKKLTDKGLEVIENKVISTYG